MRNFLLISVFIFLMVFTACGAQELHPSLTNPIIYEDYGTSSLLTTHHSLSGLNSSQMKDIYLLSLSDAERNLSNFITLNSFIPNKAAYLDTESCLQVIPGARSFVNPDHGYCTLLPANYTIGQPNPEQVFYFVSSPFDSEHPKAIIKVFNSDGRNVEKIAYEIFSDFQDFDRIINLAFTIDGEPAIVMDGVSGQDLSRHVVFTHQERAYHLVFVPNNESDYELQNQFKLLFNMVTSSFHFTS